MTLEGHRKLDDVGKRSMTNRKLVHRRYGFPAKIMLHAMWLYLRSPLSLWMPEDMLAANAIFISPQTVRLCRNGTYVVAWYQIVEGIEHGGNPSEATLCKVKEETGLKSDNFYSPDIGEQFYDVDRCTISMFHWFVGFDDGAVCGAAPSPNTRRGRVHSVETRSTSSHQSDVA